MVTTSFRRFHRNAGPAEIQFTIFGVIFYGSQRYITFLQLFWTDNFHLGIMTFIFQTGPDLESGGWGKGFIALR